ncbi:unnamed protein product [Ostreobium quekettii]|uniref:serine--tRNA ligase n=1 Tax=Ostreobium quekettii TaxID=121088 RepID=A0A8S1JGB3_9CHLO|nr:unnamed protein product [Ostreobium quekettii]|eukprot:evm.model.scf_705.5 EVM.evm.TU.scf_705.5   scf_705:39630-42929(+)
MSFPHKSCFRLVPAGRQLVTGLGFRLGHGRPAPHLCPRALGASGIADAPASSAGATAGNPPADGPAFKAYIDFKAIRENLEEVRDNCRRRNSGADPDLVVSLYNEFVEVSRECDRARAARNENSKSMKGQMEPSDRQALIEKGQQLKDELGRLEGRLTDIQNTMQREAQKIPNLTHPQTPDTEPVLVKQVGEPRDFKFKIKDHVELGEALDIIDFDAGAQVSGSKFYYLRNEGALLELALVHWTFAKAVSKGFVPVTTPDLVRSSVLEMCGFQPRADNTQVYSIADSPLCLTGTAEVPLAGSYMNRILKSADLPICMVGFGRCFRTEAGAAGMAGKGLYRVHQFSKVELFILCTPQQSEDLLKRLVDFEEELYAELGLHFKILDMPASDLGAPAERKFDMEAWMPGLQRYGELSSASNCTDYQSRRLNIRYRPDADAAASGGKKQKKLPTEFVHTLNATACAVPRLVVAILENFQQEDGTVVIPKPLIPYMGGVDRIMKF